MGVCETLRISAALHKACTGRGLVGGAAGRKLGGRQVHSGRHLIPRGVPHDWYLQQQPRLTVQCVDLMHMQTKLAKPLVLLAAAYKWCTAM